MWTDINKRYFEGVLPPAEAVELRYVPDNAEGFAFDGRYERAATSRKEGEEGKWVVEINEGLRGFLGPTYLALAHEAVHVKLGLDVDHKAASWNREIRRLTGKGLLRRVF